MKKGLIIMLGLMCVAFLSACDKPVVENPEGNVNNPEVENVEVENTEVELKTSLNSEELDELEHALLPVSYKYEKYTWESEWVLEDGEYTYNEGDPLLASLAPRTSREIESSAIEDGMIYTNTLVTLEDGSQYAVLYVNNPATLEFVAASVSDEESTTLYTFRY